MAGKRKGKRNTARKGGKSAAAAQASTAIEAYASTTAAAKATSVPASAGPPPNAKDGVLPPLVSMRASLLWCVLGGVLLGLSQPLIIDSFGSAPLLPGVSGLLAFVGLIPFFVVSHGQSVKFTYWHSALTLFVQLVIILYWLHVPINVFTPLPAVVGWLAVFALSALIAAAGAAAFGVAQMVSRRWGWHFGLIGPICFAGLEFLRNHAIFGGFPWGNLGNSLATVPVMLQGAAVVGVYGLVLLIVLFNGGVGTFIAQRLRGDVGVPLVLKVAVAAVVVDVVFGVVWMQSLGTPERTVRVSLLQGNIEQGIKNHDYQNHQFILERFHKLQQEAIDDGAEIVVWPEASLPADFTDKTTHLRDSRILPKDVRAPKERKRRRRKGQKAKPPAQEKPKESAAKIAAREKAMPPAAIVGTTLRYKVIDPDTGKKRRKKANTALVVTNNLELVGRFDKVHLVPFGEYVPWPLKRVVRRLVPGLSSFGELQGPIDLDTGKQKVKVAATVCYEGAFPELTRHFAQGDADLFFNVTNDAWYGVSSMAHQHLLMYAVRAVESGRSVARVANTGISAWIDAAGVVHDATQFYETTQVTADIPLYTRRPPYVWLGDVVPFLCLVFGVVAWMVCLLGDGFWRRRRGPVEQTAGGAMLLLVVGTLVWHYLLDDTFDERDATLTFVLYLYGSLMGVGMWGGRPWGITCQRWALRVTFVLTVISTFYGAWWMWAITAVTYALVRHARMHPEHYQRPPDVPRMPPPSSP